MKKSAIGDVILNLSVSANKMTARLINGRFPKLVEHSPTSWRPSKRYEDVYSMWIPRDRIGCDTKVQWGALMKWGDAANSHIWLERNKNTSELFSGEELDFCVAADWNKKPDDNWAYTRIGEAEYQLKYEWPKGRVARPQATEYVDTLKSAIVDCIGCLPPIAPGWCVVPVPCTAAGQSKLAYRLAQWTASHMNLPFAGNVVIPDKPSFKDASVGDKIRGWRGIMSNDDLLNLDVEGKTVLIVDDLYQSGASIWSFAEYLRRIGARHVMAVAAVKARGDGDNK